MRLAYELGFANATLFCRRPVRFLSLDKIAFTKPVSIGSILRLRSTIIHTTASERYPAIVVSLPSFLVSFSLNPSPRSTFVSKQTSWTFPQGWRKRPTTSDSRGRWRTDPIYLGMWSPRHMKVRMQSLNERFWGTRLNKWPTESMLWLEGRRSLDANQSLTNP